MRIMTATEVKNKLGDALSFPEDDNLLIERNGKPAFMVFTAATGKLMVLSAYSHGSITREDAMRLLGMDWYGELLDALADADFERPAISREQMDDMTYHAVEMLQSVGPV